MARPVTTLNAVQRQRRGPRWAQAQEGVRPGFRPHVRREARVPRPSVTRRQIEYISQLGCTFDVVITAFEGASFAIADFARITEGISFASWTTGWPGTVEDEASERAKTLFLSLLTEEQRREYEQDGCVTVTGSAGGRYWLDNFGTRGSSGSFCLQPRAPGLPTYDKMIARMLLLQTDEAAFLARANLLPY